MTREEPRRILAVTIVRILETVIGWTYQPWVLRRVPTWVPSPALKGRAPATICPFLICLLRAIKHGQHLICPLTPLGFLLLRFTTSPRLARTTLQSTAHSLEVPADRSEVHNRADQLHRCTRCYRLSIWLHQGIVFPRRCIPGCPLMLPVDVAPMFILCLSLLELLVLLHQLLLLLFRTRRLLSNRSRSRWILSGRKGS